MVPPDGRSLRDTGSACEALGFLRRWSVRSAVGSSIPRQRVRGVAFLQASVQEKFPVESPELRESRAGPFFRTAIMKPTSPVASKSNDAGSGT
jgi:hypothetical protein